MQGAFSCKIILIREKIEILIHGIVRINVTRIG